MLTVACPPIKWYGDTSARGRYAFLDMVYTSFTVIKFDIGLSCTAIDVEEEEGVTDTLFLIILFTSLLILTDCFIDC